MVVVPTDTPVTLPVVAEPVATVATAGYWLLQLVPPDEEVKVVVCVLQTVLEPEMAEGGLLTVTTCIAHALPHANTPL